jgi:hypothetical protein
MVIIFIVTSNDKIMFLDVRTNLNVIETPTSLFGGHAKGKQNIPLERWYGSTVICFT